MAYPTVRIASLDVDIPLAELQPSEQNAFDAYWNIILEEYDSVLHHALQPYRDRVVWLIQAVKAKMERSVLFEGQLPRDTNLGISFVKPIHMYKDQSPPTGVTFHDDTFEVTFDAKWKTLVDSQVDKDAGFVLFGVIEYSDGILDGLKFKVEQRELVPIELTKLKLADNKNGLKIWKFDTIYLLPETTYTIEVHSDKADSNNPPTGKFAFLGFTVATGAYLKKYF